MIIIIKETSAGHVNKLEMVVHGNSLDVLRNDCSVFIHGLFLSLDHFLTSGTYLPFFMVPTFVHGMP